MEIIKVLFVEDNKTAISQFNTNLAEFNSENDEYNITETIVDNFDQAIKILDKTFDAIILDLALNQNHNGGNDIAKRLEESNIRVPILFVSGNHGNVQKNRLVINIRSRDDGDYEDDFKLILNVYQTGLTNILGGRGEIEKKLSDIFLETILPELDIWKTHVINEDDKKNTEKALLRLVVNHLHHLLEDEETPSYPEEFYVYPIKDEILRTGTLLKCITTGNYFISLSPACDLAIRRNGTCNTDRLLIAEINNHDNIKDIALHEFSQLAKDAKTRKKVKNKLENLYGNNFTNYYHYLPKIKIFDGGFINFRRAKSIELTEYSRDYENLKIQVSSPFIKDILARFSSYYARQGQPVINSKNSINNILESYK
ncbi:hypothetical protein P255_00534 [Acinetobacter brisouii CIP 110357]|uniref:Response regulatory domain-containing protein n=1 Tax=Acinetobacter brisouii CIP 110357 TaxID=1341683 RepID=V2UD48_9GAMM|nr:response regulator [Acinetobacter brisouii]ENV46395.1 hypothetical protein F954_02374 [Acinetobacter brisouii ANC 4119]ESK52383.1 hypothetical protein P255_00534 [Acinetobacter brisouii CIP 110357]